MFFCFYLPIFLNVKMCLSVNRLLIVVGFLVIANTRAYVFGPPIDGEIIDFQQYTYFFKCRAAGFLISTALKLHIPLINIPPHPVTDKNVTFLLYTRKNPANAQTLRVHEPAKSIQSTNINFRKQTVLYVHGLNETYHEGAKIFTTLLLPRDDINVVIMDWDSYAFFDEFYLRNITTPRLGIILGDFLRTLINAGADAKKIHLVGYSMGGQIVGLAAKRINPKVARITAFDQQGSCFNFLPPTKRLAKTDADYVQIVRCTVGQSATRLDITGDSTFYMNNALIQPQCRNQTTIKELSICSHIACGDYLRISLKRIANNPLKGVKCATYANYLLGNCDCTVQIPLTYDVSTSVKGIYFVSTNPSKQLCRGTGVTPNL